jgi:putative phosphoribosyl transferase
VSPAVSTPRYRASFLYTVRMVFADRTDAGEKLGEVLAERSYARPLVLALPRGGVVVGLEVARALRCPLDTLVVRKVGAPLNPEWAVGAVAPHGAVYIDDEALSDAHISRASVEGVIAAEQKELQRRVDAYRSGSYSVGFIPKTVIVVDDGVATGMSARAALAAARSRYSAAHIVFAAPVSLGRSEKALKRDADEVVVLEKPSGIYAVGRAYERFPQTSDEEVRKCLRAAKSF